MSDLASRSPVNADSSPQGFWKRNPFVCIAFVLAIAALALVVLPDSILEPPKSPRGVGGLLHWLSSKPDPAMVAFETRIRYLTLAGLSVGIMAVALAIIGIVRHERRAIALAALAVASVALIWQYLVVGVVVVVIALILIGLAQ